MFKYSVTITSATRTLYYRPAQGGCNCRSFYDGQDDLSFNLDNKYLFTYGLLFQYLHLMIEGKNPLAAFHRSAGRCYGVLGTTQPPTLKIVCSAWNAFARLLDHSQEANCSLCFVLWRRTPKHFAISSHSYNIGNKLQYRTTSLSGAFHRISSAATLLSVVPFSTSEMKR